MSALRIGPDDAAAPDVLELARTHRRWAGEHSPPEDVHAVEAEALLHPAMTLLTARGEDGGLVGMVALRELDAGHAELKAMHVRPTGRGRGVGAALLERALALARSRGYRRVSLETGTTEAFSSARALYARAGFAPCAPFGPYRSSPASVCLTRLLDRPVHDRPQEAPEMERVDLKAERKDLYAPARGRFVEVVVPPMAFLAVDGHGDPNTSEDHRHAVQALFAVSYAARSLSRRELGRDYVVLPLEGLWSATDWTAFERRAKQDWSWTMLVRQPDWLTPDVLDRARDQARARRLPALDRVRSCTLDEGLCVQTLHVGSYDDEAPLLRTLHREHLPQHALAPTGPHHELYLSDPRRTLPDRLRTVLRQPVRRLQASGGAAWPAG